MNIDEMTYEELIELNRQIVQRLKFLDHVRTHSEMMEFRIGERIRFQSSGGDEVLGTLVKFNKKTVTIVTEQGERWNVSPGLLSKADVQESESDEAGKIIDMDEGRSA